MFALVNSLAAAGFAQNDVAKMLSELKKFGANGHLYIPGPGVPILGPELSGGSWATGGGLSILNGVITGTGGTGALRLQPYAGTLTIGRQYKVSLSITTRSGGSISLPYDGTNGQVRSSVGVHEFTFIATTNDVYVYSAGFIGTATAYSVKEIISYSNTINGITAGNYLDSIGANQATVDGNVGLVLDGAGSIGAELAGLSTAWSSYGAGISLSAGKMVFAATPAGQFAMWGTPLGAGKTYQLELTIDSISGGGIQMLVGGGAGTVTATTPGTYRGVVKATETDGPYLWVNTSATNAVVSAASCKEVTGIRATQATTGYQPKLRRDSAGAYKWEFDGTDDFMSLGSIPFQMADDHYGAVALTPNAVNTGKHILNPANGAASQQVGTISVNGNSQFSARWCDDATNLLGVADTVTVTPGVASVLASRRVGTTGVMRKNGAQVGSISLASLGATTLTLPGVIGSYKAGANPSAISLYGVVVIKGTVTDAQALIFERGLNALSQYAAGRF